MEIISDTFLIFQRYMRQAFRNPVFMVFGLIQPVLYLCLFAPLLTRFTGQAGFPEGDSWQFYIPGLLVQLGLLGTTFAGFGLIGEWRMGIFERMRVTPVSRTALLLGRVFRDVFVALLQALVLIVAGFAFGLRAPVLGILIGLFFVGMIAISAASLSYSAALTLKSEDAFAPLLNIFYVPLFLLTGILLPMSLAPDWLNWLSRLNPLRYILDAMRDAYLGHYWTTTVLIGTVIALALVGFTVALGSRTFRRENA
jgi:ABC-2 type transport system permease protein